MVDLPYKGRILSVICLIALVMLLNHFWPQLEAWLYNLSTIQLGLLASLVAGLFTAVGALPIFFMRNITRKMEDTLMGFGAGVMLAATAFELVLPAANMAQADWGNSWIAAMVVASGIAVGAGIIFIIERIVPHEHFVLGRQHVVDAIKVKRVYLFIFAIALHNVPEGLAVGIGFGGETLADGVALAIGIGLQNMPEGLVVAVALMSLGYSRGIAFGVALLTGLVQPVGGLIGVMAVTFIEALMPWALAFAAGAMLFVISHEIIPESHRAGHEGNATFGVILGFIIMLTIDMVIG